MFLFFSLCFYSGCDCPGLLAFPQFCNRSSPKILRQRACFRRITQIPQTFLQGELFRVRHGKSKAFGMWYRSSSLWVGPQVTVSVELKEVLHNNSCYRSNTSRSVTKPLPGRDHSQADKQQRLHSDFWKQSLSHAAWARSHILCPFEIWDWASWCSESASAQTGMWMFGGPLYQVGKHFLCHCGFQMSVPFKI